MVRNFFGLFQEWVGSWREEEVNQLPEKRIDKETLNFLSWGGTGVHSREISSVFQESTPGACTITQGSTTFCVSPSSCSLEAMPTPAPGPRGFGKGRSGRHSQLWQESLYSWEVSELLCVLVASIADWVQDHLPPCLPNQNIEVNEIACKVIASSYNSKYYYSS